MSNRTSRLGRGDQLRTARRVEIWLGRRGSDCWPLDDIGVATGSGVAVSRARWRRSGCFGPGNDAAGILDFGPGLVEQLGGSVTGLGYGHRCLVVGCRCGLKPSYHQLKTLLEGREPLVVLVERGGEPGWMAGRLVEAGQLGRGWVSDGTCRRFDRGSCEQLVMGLTNALKKGAHLGLVVAVGARRERPVGDLFGRQGHKKGLAFGGRNGIDPARLPISTSPEGTRQMQVHLVDGTYELFRYHFAPGRPTRETDDGQDVGATIGVIQSMFQMVDSGVTHLAIATDHVIESWRNELYDGYKDGSGVPDELYSQFGLLEQGLDLAGFQVWPMVEFEADDALAAGAVMAAADPRVERVFICTPDKDLGQCVTSDGRIVQFDRRKRLLIDEAAVIEKFGVAPASIPDYLALVGDSADGFPGLKGWGAKSTATVLAQYGHIESIPDAPGQWEVTVRGAAKLAATLAEHRDDAYLFRRIATVDTEGPEIGTVNELAVQPTRPGFAEFCERLNAPHLIR